MKPRVTIESDHPLHIFNNIPRSLFLRNRRICDFYSDYISICCIHISGLLKKGYEKVTLIKI